MTELERARAHLRDVQLLLVSARMEGFPFRAMQVCEETVLAALSWVWEEQMKIEIPLQYELVWARS